MSDVATLPPARATAQATHDLPPTVEVVNLSKCFGELQALAGVSLTLEPGTVRALLGENGAGKSTLVKCIMGTYRADAGTVRVGAGAVVPRNPRQAHAVGLGMVHQHFTLVENMTVVENMVLARDRLPPVIRWKAEADALRRFMEGMPFRIDPVWVVRDLSAGEKQKVEILRQLYYRRKVLLLDEPTSVLTPQEADEVLGLVRGLCRAGRLSVLIITHKFREVLAYCDEVTVLRHGKVTGAGRVGDLTTQDMARMMMGTTTLPERAVRDAAPPARATARLVVKDLTADGERGVPVLRGLSLEARAHEIVGVAGVSGNGQRQLIEVLAGQRVPSGGQVHVHGQPYRATRRELQRHRFHVLPEMPLYNACVGTMTTAENLAFRTFDRPPITWARWFLNFGAIRRRARDLIARFRIRPAAPGVRIATLSGGNVQRAVLARELGEDVDVLVAANPCFGLDFRATAEIRARLVEARNRGAAVLLVSEDLDEILELADRVLVLFHGRIVYEAAAAEADRQVIGRHMAGHA